MLVTRKQLVTMAWALGCVVVGVSGLRAAPRATLKYTNAEFVSLDLPRHALVVRNNEGKEQTLELEDNLAGLAELRPGDRVILTLRGDPDRPRVGALWKASPPGKAASPAEPSAAAVVTGEDAEQAEVEYSRRVADLARQADEIDRIWAGFRTVCDVRTQRRYEGSREWLSLWEATPTDLSSGYCRDRFNQIVTRGQSVNAGMAAAEADAARELQPGRIRAIQKRYSLEWSEWGRTPPNPSEP